MTAALAVFALLSFTGPQAGLASPPAGPDAVVQRIVRAIDARRIERTVRTLVSFGTRHTASSQDDPARGIGAARRWLLSEMQAISADSGGRLQVQAPVYKIPPAAEHPGGLSVTDIVATLPGDEVGPNDRLYLVSGHYDSRATDIRDATSDAPGADDDGSGVALVLELARVMSHYHFRAPIVFACVAGEEEGLYGSIGLAEEMRAKGVQVATMLDNDIVGDTTGENGVHDDRTVRLFAEGLPSGEMTATELRALKAAGAENDLPPRQLARYIKEAGERAVPRFHVTLVYRRDRYLRGGDHIPFLERGFPAVRFTEPNEDFRHQHQNVRVENGVQYGDLPAYVDFAYTGRVAGVNAAALAGLALAPAPPRAVRIVARRLTPDTDLEWQPGRAADRDVAGYEVVWRATTSPVWDHSLYVGAVTQTTVRGVSKDDYLFGVRSVDAQGHRSVVSFAWPGR